MGADAAGRDLPVGRPLRAVLESVLSIGGAVGSLPSPAASTGSGRPEPNSGLLLLQGAPDRAVRQDFVFYVAQPKGLRPEFTMTKMPPSGRTPIQDRIQAEML